MLNCIIDRLLKRKLVLLLGLGQPLVKSNRRVLMTYAFGTVDRFDRFMTMIGKNDIVLATDTFVRYNPWIVNKNIKLVKTGTGETLNILRGVITDTDKKINRIIVLGDAKSFTEMAPLVNELRFVECPVAPQDKTRTLIDRRVVSNMVRKVDMVSVDRMFSSNEAHTAHSLRMRSVTTKHITKLLEQARKTALRELCASMIGLSIQRDV